MSKGLMSTEQKSALERLIRIAKTDSGGGRRVADFLLAWWNAPECGSFDMTSLWGVDPSVAADMVKVFGFISTNHKYPDQFGYEKDFAHILAVWRPEISGGKKPISSDERQQTEDALQAEMRDHYIALLSACVKLYRLTRSASNCEGRAAPAFEEDAAVKNWLNRFGISPQSYDKAKKMGYINE